MPQEIPQEKMLNLIRNYQNNTAGKYHQIIEHNRILKADLKNVQNQLYSKTKPIRVTDDDYSTIISNLGKFFGKVNNFAPNCKSSIRKDLTADEVAGLFPEEYDQAQIKRISIDNKLEYSFVAVLIEKFLSEVLITNVFTRGIHLDSEVNNAYKTLVNLFESANHSDWAKDLRLKSARSTFELLESGDPVTVANIKKSKSLIVDEIVRQLMTLYSTDELVRPRIEKLVDMAANLCLPMHGQENPIELYFLKPFDKVIEKQVKRAFRPVEVPDKSIYLGISPVFLAKSTIEVEDDLVVDTYLDGYTLIYQGKAIW